MATLNFVIKANGTLNHKPQFFAEDAAGKLLATISPRLMANGKYSDRFQNVCFNDGSVEIADTEDESCSKEEVIARKLFA